ncbi:AtMMH-1 [Amylocystis lapponica]|nr:AtMMH-1 [Amylocystis lapponica]
MTEVERAAKLIRGVAVGKRILKVDTVEDRVVFSGAAHAEFASTLAQSWRAGKVFYVRLDGHGRMPVLHFGMTGMLQVKGQLATYYRETPRKASTDWPPKFMKVALYPNMCLSEDFNLHLINEETNEMTELAFLDARRLGRIRLCMSPLTEPPISTLGFDPILSMPNLEDFKKAVSRRACPIKALLLDQSFSAGVGNWVADEILYHARVHPEERCNALTDSKLETLHTQTAEVCRIAVEADADDSKFPDDWLFKHRWGKGKKKQHSMTLPDGNPATIKWLTVGGRTSAYVAELQRLPSRAAAKQQQGDGGSESDLTPLSDEDEDFVPPAIRKRKVSSILCSLHWRY